MTYQSKFHGATDNNGSRISVTDWNGKKTYHHYRHEFNAGRAHRAAIEERAKLDNVTEPCAVFVSVPSGGYLWTTCNEANEVIIHPSAKVVARMNDYLYWIGKIETGETWYNITPKEQDAPKGGYLLPETICKIKKLPNLFGDTYK